MPNSTKAELKTLSAKVKTVPVTTLEEVETRDRDGLTFKERVFVTALVDNGGLLKEAAIKAGFTDRFAQSRAEDLVSKAHIQLAVAQRQQDLHKINVVDKGWVQLRLVRIAEEAEDVALKLKALDMLAKMAGAYTDATANTFVQNNIGSIRVEVVKSRG